MAVTTVNYKYDLKRVPSGFDQAAFDAAVNEELEKNLGVGTSDKIAHSAVKGMLLLDEQADPSAFGFSQSVQKVWFEFLGKTQNNSGTSVPNRDVYAKIEEILPGLPGRGSSTEIFHQEFAFVGRYVISRAEDVPLGHPSFGTQVRLGDDAYVSAEQPFGSLELPPLTGADGTDQEVQPDNVRAFGTIFFAYQLEQLKLFAVVDRLVELFMNGMLAIGLDKGGQLLNKQYNYSVNDPAYMNLQSRYMHYSRLFGARGGEVSREIQPNTDFDKLWMRALSSLSEYDRQQSISDLFSGQQQPRTLSRTGEHVRSAIRDLANNVSLYGWGYTHFAARNLADQISRALEILSSPFIQKTCAATTPWQVIEYYARDLGAVPNIVKYRTIAQEGLELYKLIAKYAKVWSGSSGLPLFPDPVPPGIPTTTAVTKTSDIPEPDMIKFMRSSEQILAVTGIKDDQVTEYSEPAESISAPSMPIMADSDHGSGGLDQIRQIVAQGRAPTMEELQKLMSNGGVKVAA